MAMSFSFDFINILHAHRGFDVGVGIVVAELEVITGETEDVFYFGVDPHGRQFLRYPSELQIRLIKVVLVEMKVAEGMHEVARFVAADLGYHLC